MRRPPPLLLHASRFAYSNASSTAMPRLPVIKITDSTFYRHHPASIPSTSHSHVANPPYFPKLNFELPSFAETPQYWAIIGPSSSGKTTFLEVLRGRHLCLPPDGRSFPYLNSVEIERKDHRLRLPSRAIQYVGFGSETGGFGGAGTRRAYLSARYESRREETDFSVLDFLQGHTDLNPMETDESSELAAKARPLLDRVIRDLRLENLMELPIGNLSNGQKRRAVIAKALLGSPEVLLLDEPFMGLDPPTLTAFSPLLYRLASSSSPRLVLSLRPQDIIPDWITHIIRLGPNFTIAHQGPKSQVLSQVRGEDLSNPDLRDGIWLPKAKTPGNRAGKRRDSKDSTGTSDETVLTSEQSEPLVEMKGVTVRYGDRVVVGDWKEESKKKGNGTGLWWTVRRGERWGLFGANGSGKTTILSLICSDHPQTYSVPMQLFGHPRLPSPGQPGISIFDIQQRIGHTSPEIHAFFPKNVTVRQVIENAWGETFLGKAKLNHDRDQDVDACLRWFHAELNPGASATLRKSAVEEFGLYKSVAERFHGRSFSRKSVNELRLEEVFSTDLDWADSLRFGDLPFSAQRVALFLRAIIKRPDLVILDEAFTGMDDYVRDKCILFLTSGETRALSVERNDKGVEEWKDTESIVSRWERVRIHGLGKDQALICISHVEKEVPSIVNRSLKLPDPNSGSPPRFWKHGLNRKDGDGSWDDIWQT